MKVSICYVYAKRTTVRYARIVQYTDCVSGSGCTVVDNEFYVEDDGTVGKALQCKITDSYQTRCEPFYTLREKEKLVQSVSSTACLDESIFFVYYFFFFSKKFYLRRMVLFQRK